jgi:beta-1,4-mannosyltransferase
MKVLVFPNTIRGNPYFQIFLHGLQAAGVEDVRLSNVLRLRSAFDAMHLHHPEHAVTQGSWLKSTFVSAALLAVAVYARLAGRPVVWMVHDVEPAWVRRKTLLSAFMNAITRLTTAYIFLNKSSQQFFYRKYPQELGKPFCFAPHSRFHTTTFSATELKEHRQIHGIGETDILISFLGDITPHKGLESAALVPARTSTGRAVKLAVCGKTDDVLPRNYVDDILRQRPDQAYTRIPRRLTDEELALWIQCSDAVVLAYRSGSNSGMALNVLSNHGRIIASDLPMFRELEERCGPDWVRSLDVRDPAAIAATVDELEAWMEQERNDDRLEAMLAEGDPNENGRTLRELYHRLRRRRVQSVLDDRLVTK